MDPLRQPRDQDIGAGGGKRATDRRFDIALFRTAAHGDIRHHVAIEQMRALRRMGDESAPGFEVQRA